METVTQVQILEEVVCISLQTNALEEKKAWNYQFFSRPSNE